MDARTFHLYGTAASAIVHGDYSLQLYDFLRGKNSMLQFVQWPHTHTRTKKKTAIKDKFLAHSAIYILQQTKADHQN